MILSPPFLSPASQKVAAPNGDTSLGHFTVPSVSSTFPIKPIPYENLALFFFFFFRLAPDQSPNFPKEVISQLLLLSIPALVLTAQMLRLLCSSQKDRGRYHVHHCSKHLKRDNKALESLKGSKEDDAGTRSGWWMKTGRVIRTINSRKTECERRYHLNSWNESCEDSRTDLSTLARMHSLKS